MTIRAWPTLQTALVALAFWLPASVGAQVPCDDPAAGPRIAGSHDRLQADHDLARFATATHGEAEACEYEATTEFDGVEFGIIRLFYSEGVIFSFASWPPETTVITLESPAGFADEAGVEAALRAYAEQVGFAIDWSMPEVRVEGGETRTTFWDPELDLNASASLTRSDDRLVEVRISWAL